MALTLDPGWSSIFTETSSAAIGWARDRSSAAAGTAPGFHGHEQPTQLPFIKVINGRVEFIQADARGVFDGQMMLRKCLLDDVQELAALVRFAAQVVIERNVGMTSEIGEMGCQSFVVTRVALPQASAARRTFTLVVSILVCGDAGKLSPG